MPKKHHPLAICVINLKGGVGKSTICALLCRHAYRNLELDVLAIDLDPQANLSQALMRENYEDFLDNKEPSIVEVFSGYAPPSSKTKSAATLSGQDVAFTVAGNETRSLQLIPSRFDFSAALTDAIRPDPKVLAKFLANEFQNKDLIMIDCSPTESILTRAAYHASGSVLVPVKPEFFATIGFPLLQQSLVAFRSGNRGHTINVAGVVINNAFYHGGNNGGPEKTRAMGEIRIEAASNGWPIFENEVPCSRGFPKMMRGDNSYLGNAVNFHHFAAEFFQSVGL